MSDSTAAFKAVFGEHVALDANGKPIERGIGNIHDRAKKLAAKAAVQTAPAVGAAASPAASGATPAATPVAAAPVATHSHGLIEKIKEALAHGEANAEAEIEKLVSDL